MVLDPLSALSAAAAVLQCIDFSAKLISKTREYHSSASGMLVEHAVIRDAAEILNEQCETLQKLERLHKDDQNENVMKSPLPGEETLANVISSALEIANELGTVIDELRVDGSKTVFKSFRQALKSVCGKERVEKMLRRLTDLRSSLILSLMIVLRAENVKFVEENQQSLKELELHILQAIKATHHDHLAQIKALGRAADPDKFDRLRKLELPWNVRKSRIEAAATWHQHHSGITTDLSNRISSGVTLVNQRQAYESMLKSLSFHEMDKRYHRISEAEERTFQWVFDPDAMSHTRWSNFVQWLTSGEGGSAQIYWIAGKAGSGKSTLMRYILDEPRTKQLAAQWAGGQDILFASCFFWAAGTPLQTSTEGLLQTLLYQLLTQRPSLTSWLFEDRQHLLELGFSVSHQWSESELWKDINLVIDRLGRDCKILIFIDGLDEYHGTDAQRQSMCTSLKALTDNEAVKLCVSARPWNVYLDAFKNEPQLRVEDLTKDDITNFVTDVFARSEAFRDWSALEPVNAEALLTGIVQKAQGVFLWVRMVSNSLTNGLRNGDDARDLAERLEATPADLEPYFERMLGTLEKFYLEQASQIFALALANTTLLMTFYFSRMVSTGTSDAFSGIAKLTPAAVDHLQKVEERRLKGRCMDLLEVSTIPNTSMKTVDFIHRTARDFISSEPIHCRLRNWRKSSFDAEEVQFHALVAQILSITDQAPWIDQEESDWTLAKALRLARALQARNKSIAVPLSHLQRRIDPIWANLSNRCSGYPSHPSVVGDFLGLAIQHGLREYVLADLQTQKTRSKLEPPWGNPYLALAIDATWDYLKEDGLSIPVISRLLMMGCDPNEEYGSSTVWGDFLETLLECPDETLTRKQGQHSQAAEIARLMIEYGAVTIVKRKNLLRGFSRYVSTINPTRAFRRVLYMDEAKELEKILERSAHGKLKNKALRTVNGSNLRR